MEIKDNRKPEFINFEDVGFGCVFECKERDHGFSMNKYLRISDITRGEITYNSVDFTDFNLVSLKADCKVKVLKATLTIE